jgi:hypothetical protein
VSVVSGTPNKRESPKNLSHSPKRKLFSQRKSPVEFTPVSEDEKRKQSSKYMYKPNLQLHHIIKVNRKGDAKGCNRGVKVAAVACAQKKSQHSKNIAPCDTRNSDLVVCNTKCSCQGTGTHQENSVGNSGGPFTKENTIKESRTLVSEGDLLKLRGVSENCILDNNTLHLNNEANKNDQELQISLTHSDSLLRLSRSSSSESHLNIVSGEGTEYELNVPTCPDTPQEKLDDDKVNEEEVGRNNLSFGAQTALNKESKIIGMSIEGGNEGETLNESIHESISDKGEEVQLVSSRHILKDKSVVEELSCGKPQDKKISEKSSCELNLGGLSDKQSLLKNDHPVHRVTICTKTQSGDKNAVTKSLSQSSCFEGSESHSCRHDNSLNGEDITPGEGGHIFQLKHSIPDEKLSEKGGNEGEEIDEECIEKYLNLDIMQPCREEYEINSGKISTDDNNINGSDVPMLDMHKIYRKNVAHLNISNSINDILNESVYMLKDDQFEILDISEIISIRADGNQQKSGTGDTEHVSKETSGTRILSGNSRTTDNTCDILLAQPDPTVSNSSKVLYLPAEKRIPSVRQNRHTVFTELIEKELVGSLSADSDKKSGQIQTQATLQNGLGTGQTIKTRCNNKSSLTSSRNNPNRKFSQVVTQVTKNDDKHLSQADSSLWKSGKNIIIKKCKQNEDCINAIHAKEKILNDLLSQREGATSESCCTVNTLGQTDVYKTVYFSSSKSSLASSVERSCKLVPENIAANAVQQSSEESSFCCPCQELASPPSSSSLPPEESGCSQKKGNFFLILFRYFLQFRGNYR